MNKSSGILRGVMTLGSASVVDYAIQFFLPMILVRSLDATEFGQYRILWLMTNTLMAFAPMYMPQSLFYFLPRHDAAGRGKFVANALWFLFITGAIAAAIGCGMSLHSEGTERELPGVISIIPLFLWLWVVSSLVEWLANTEGRVGAQARIIVALSFLRAVLVGGVALVTQDITAVFWALAAYAGLRFFVLMCSIVTRYGIAGLLPDWSKAKSQLLYALPFGMAGCLFVLRQQGDQWIVASLFSVEEFAAFSIAGVVAPLAGLVRQAVSNAILPTMNMQHGEGNASAALALNRQSNTIVAFALLPILGFLFVFAEEIISVIYTSRYAAAVEPMRVYLVGLVGQILVVNNLLITYAQGRFQLVLNIAFLIVAVSLSFAGAYWYGIAGAAFGTAVAQWGSHIVSIWYVKRLTNVKAGQLLDFAALYQFLLVSMFAGLIALYIVNGAGLQTHIPRLMAGAFSFMATFVLVCMVLSPKYRGTLLGVLKR